MICATRSRGEFVDVVRGLWDSWDDDAIVADKATGTFIDQVEGPAARSQGAVLSGQGPAQHRAPPQGHPVIIQAGGSAPGQELSARVGRPGVLRGQRRQGLGQDRLRQPEAARGQARPGAARAADPARRDADHRRNRRAGQGAARASAKLADADQRAGAGVAADRARYLRLSARRAGARFPARPSAARRSRRCCWRWRAAKK